MKYIKQYTSILQTAKIVFNNGKMDYTLDYNIRFEDKNTVSMDFKSKDEAEYHLASMLSTKQLYSYSDYRILYNNDNTIKNILYKA